MTTPIERDPMDVPGYERPRRHPQGEPEPTRRPEPITEPEPGPGEIPGRPRPKWHGRFRSWLRNQLGIHDDYESYTLMLQLIASNIEVLIKRQTFLTKRHDQLVLDHNNAVTQLVNSNNDLEQRLSYYEEHSEIIRYYRARYDREQTLQLREEPEMDADDLREVPTSGSTEAERTSNYLSQLAEELDENPDLEEERERVFEADPRD